MELIALPHKVYESAVNEIVKNILQKSEDECEIKCSAGSSKGDNYMGTIYRVDVIDKKEKKSILKLIAKLPPENHTRRSEFLIHECFERETTFYNSIYPLYRKFQDEKGINAELEGFHHIACCNKSLTEEPYEALFFEDLKECGFEIFDRFKDVTKDHVFLVMKALAKMHAIFFCIKDQNPILIEPFKTIEDYFFTQFKREHSPLKTYFEGSKSQALDVISKNGSDKIVKRVHSFLAENISELIESCFDRDITEPYAVVCHGDCWNNNIMYRNNENGIPTDVRLLDFQMMRYASPVTDVMFYIFLCTSKDLRDKHYQEFLDVYYETLSSFILRLGSNPEKLFPRHIFNDHLKKFGKFGLVMNILLLRAMVVVPSDSVDMDRVSERLKNSVHLKTQLTRSKMSEISSNLYRKKLFEVCEDMCDFGFI